MAIWTIAGLTIKEAVRRKTLIGSLLLGLVVFGLSLILLSIRARMAHQLDKGIYSPEMFHERYNYARSAITLLCLSTIKKLSALFALLLAGGAIAGEIERGLLAVILPKPIPRWHILIGKWLGYNAILVGSVLLWTLMVWVSLSWQTHLRLLPILKAGFVLSLFPIIVCTLTLCLSTFAQRLLGTSLALTLIVLGWLDGIFNSLGETFDVDFLHDLSNVASLVFPQSVIGWWVERIVDPIISLPPVRAQLGYSPQFLSEMGSDLLRFPRFDLLYALLYTVALLLIGVFVFQKRDV